MCSLTVLRGGSSKSMFGQGESPSETLVDPSLPLSASGSGLQSWAFLGFQLYQCNLYLFCHVVFSLCLCPYVTFSSSYKETGHIGLGPTLMTLSELNYIFKDPISEWDPIHRYKKLGLSAYFSGDVIQLIKSGNPGRAPGFLYGSPLSPH